MSSTLMDDFRLIRAIVHKWYDPTLKDVDYKYIRPTIISEDILTPNQLSELNAKTDLKQNEELFLEYAPLLGMVRFKKLINAIRGAYPHVATILIDELNANQNPNASLPSMSSGSYTHSSAASGAVGFTQTSKPSDSTTLSDTMGRTNVITTKQMGLRELPDSMQPFHLTGNECQEDVKMMMSRDPEFAKQVSMNARHFVEHPSGVQANEQPIPQVTSDERYNMNTRPKGVAFIISNEDFKHLKKREGTEMDRQNLVSMFHDLGWQVTSKKNLTAKEMVMYLGKLAENERLRSASALAVAILTHGLDSDILFGSDGNLIDTTPVPGTYIQRFQLMKKFTCSNCKVMEGKPKWFILQACRGTEEDILPTPHRQTSQQLDSDTPTRTPFLDNEVQPQNPLRRTPEMADMCCLFASSPGHKAYRMRNSGSPFINTLIECVKNLASTEEICSILRKVRSKLSQERLPNNKMTLPEFSSLLLKEWYLNPT